jgi:hypothetical protein
MVTSMQQATRIQQKRVEDGKQGFAHAVRRYFKRISKDPKTGKVDWYATNELKLKVPFIFIDEAEKPEPEATLADLI